MSFFLHRTQYHSFTSDTYYAFFFFSFTDTATNLEMTTSSSFFLNLNKRRSDNSDRDNLVWFKRSVWKMPKSSTSIPSAHAKTSKKKKNRYNVNLSAGNICTFDRERRRPFRKWNFQYKFRVYFATKMPEGHRSGLTLISSSFVSNK